MVWLNQNWRFCWAWLTLLDVQFMHFTCWIFLEENLMYVNFLLNMYCLIAILSIYFCSSVNRFLLMGFGLCKCSPHMHKCLWVLCKCSPHMHKCAPSVYSCWFELLAKIYRCCSLTLFQFKRTISSPLPEAPSDFLWSVGSHDSAKNN